MTSATRSKEKKEKKQGTVVQVDTYENAAKNLVRLFMFTEEWFSVIEIKLHLTSMIDSERQRGNRIILQAVDRS